MIYLQLFLTYLKIGLFGFGGGYAMLSFIQDEIVAKHQWISVQNFTDIVAVSQMTPGPIGINTATYVGYTVTGSVWGSVVATTAICIPSLILVLIISYFYEKFKNNRAIASIFSGIRTVVVGFIAAAAISLITPETFIDYYSWIFFIVSFVLVRYFKFNPILLIIIAGGAGWLLYG